MEISLDRSDNRFQIQSYENGIIRINNQDYQKPLLVGLDHLNSDIISKAVKEITIDDLMAWEIDQFEVVLLGTGKTMQFPNWELLEQAQLKGKPLEVMATDAACRTFTVLAGEGRKVLAILFP